MFHNTESKLPALASGLCVQRGGGLPRPWSSRARSTVAAERRARDSAAGGGRGRRGAWFAALRAPRSGALSAALSLPRDRKRERETEQRGRSGEQGKRDPDLGQPQSAPSPLAGPAAGERGCGAPAPGCVGKRAGWGGERGRKSAREGKGRGRGWEGPRAGGGGGGGWKRDPTRCWSPSPATGNFARVGRARCVEGAANLSAGGAPRDWSERQRVAFVSSASLCHLRAPARRSARLGRGLHRGLRRSGSALIPSTVPVGPRPPRSGSADCFRSSRHAWAGKILNAA